MNFNLISLKLISSIALSIGILASSTIANAASSKTAIDRGSTKPKTVELRKNNEEHHENGSLPKFLLSKKAQQIEFFAFLGMLGFAVFAPELFYHPKQNSQSLETDVTYQDRQEQVKKVESDDSSLKVIVIPKNTKTLSLVDDNLNLEDLERQEKSAREVFSDRDRNAA